MPAVRPSLTGVGAEFLLGVALIGTAAQANPCPPPWPAPQDAPARVPEEAPRVRSLLELLRDPVMRQCVLQDLDADRARSVLPELIRLADDPDPRTRWGALAALGTSGDPAAVPTLARALERENPGERAEAARSLGAIGAAAEPAIGGLLRLLREDDQHVEEPAMFALGQMGLVAVPAVRRELGRDGAPVGRLLYTLILAGATAEVVIAECEPRLAKPELTASAAGTLARLGPAAAPAIPAMLRVLPEATDSHPVSRALAEIGEPALHALLAELRSPEGVRRRRAARALVAFGASAAPGLPRLVEALRGRDAWGPGERAEMEIQSAVELDLERVLRGIGPPAIAALLPTLRDRDARMRRTGAGVLGSIGRESRCFSTAVVDALRIAADDEDPNVRDAAVGALAWAGAAAVPAARVLARRLADASEQTRAGAAEGLRRTGDQTPEVVAALIAALDDRAWTVRAEVVLALGALPRAGPDVIHAIRKRLADPEPVIRVRAAAALWATASDSEVAIRVARDALTLPAPESTPASGDPLRTLVEAAHLLAMIGPAAESAVPDLVAVLGHPVTTARDAAIAALGDLGPSARDAVPALEALLDAGAPEEEDLGARWGAAAALGGIGAPAARSAAKIERLLDEQVGAAIAIGALALLRIAEPESRPSASPRPWERLRDWDRRRSLLGPYIEHGLDLPALWLRLRHLVESGTGSGRQAAARLVARVEALRVPFLQEALESEDPVARAHALDGLRLRLPDER